ncbi:hypothetical protein PHYBOEH_003947 [Phytophthora boehmeriae]|uniref:Fe2OG dioxygenase domain-containing protein n=1 Tax=Phytophthora boehmeriae TaxID=109152 RepID=A0A8T1WPH8_9STRA|nr:hypothetical protein PHYBOEH_003947 [Phytophthora boehmeriae]
MKSSDESSDEYSSEDYHSDEFVDDDEHRDFKRSWPFGSKGKATDVLAPSGAACLQMNKILARAEESAGDFTFGGQADMLPVAPGIKVEGVGSIPVPLTEDIARKLIAVGEKSPFGRKHETLIDENVRKSWQLESNRVEFKNPMWHTGMEILSATIADRLGYEGVPLQCMLYKVLVYAEGGHFTKHKDTEKEDGMIATLVIQPPSLHEGGDLVVYRDRTTAYRHDFGKKDGTAAYLPHFAVHYADAEHALEKVTKGYRLALVYSICLPRTMRHLCRDHYQPLSDDLASAIRTMQDGDDSFALLLSHQYTEKSIGELGTRALKGVDRARFHALEEANNAVTTDKKLCFYIAQLHHTLKFYYDYDKTEDDGWEEYRDEASIVFRSTSGEYIGSSPVSKSPQLNFLNPGQETHGHLWRPYGSSTYEGEHGNEASEKCTKYSRYAIITWSSKQSVENALKFISEDFALKMLQQEKHRESESFGAFTDAASKIISEDIAAVVRRCQTSIDATAIRSFIDAVRKQHHWFMQLSISFCTGVCALVVDVGDPTLVGHFFKLFLEDLKKLTDKEALIPALADIVRSFDWEAIGKTVLGLLADLADTSVMEMNLTLQLADGLDKGPGQSALLNAAARKAVSLDDAELCYSKPVGLLWKWAIRSEDNHIFESVVAKFKRIDPSLLRPSIEESSHLATEMNELDAKFAVVVFIVEKRIKWLNHQVRALDKPFSWKMPDASFPECTEVESFLHGPEVSLNTAEILSFGHIQDARNCAAKWQNKLQLNASFEVEAGGSAGKFFVTIMKTRRWFSIRQEKLRRHKEELSLLLQRFSGLSGSDHSTAEEEK